MVTWEKCAKFLTILVSESNLICHPQCSINYFTISAKITKMNEMISSGRQQQLDSTAFQVPLAFFAVIISFMDFQMLSNKTLNIPNNVLMQLHNYKI